MEGHAPERVLRERECIHLPSGRAGTFYTGAQFGAALCRLRGEAGASMARKVHAFFWADAPFVAVWLCSECEAEAGLGSEAQVLDAA